MRDAFFGQTDDRHETIFTLSLLAPSPRWFVYARSSLAPLRRASEETLILVLSLRVRGSVVPAAPGLAPSEGLDLVLLLDSSCSIFLLKVHHECTSTS